MVKHKMVIPKAPVDAWQKLYDAAGRFLTLKPWNDMCDEDYLGITDPKTGQFYVGMVMGNLGMFFAFAMYREREGTEFCRLVLDQSSAWSMRPDIALAQNNIMVEFGTKKDLDQTDLDVLKQVSWKAPKRSPQSHLKFRNVRPYLFPWYLDAEEVRVLTLGLERMVEYCEFRRAGNLLLTVDAKHLPAVRGDAGASKYYLEEWAKWPELPEEPDASATLADRVKNLGKSIRKTGGRWQLAGWPICMPMKSETRPYFPRITLAVDEESHYALGQHLGDPEEQPGITLATLLLESMETSGFRPNEVQVLPSRHNATIKAVCAQLKIPIREQERLASFEELYRDLDNHIMHQTPR